MQLNPAVLQNQRRKKREREDTDCRCSLNRFKCRITFNKSYHECNDYKHLAIPPCLITTLDESIDSYDDAVVEIISVFDPNGYEFIH